MTYADKLKDPRWQKRRLEVLERDGWACLKCGDKENTLHVHHLKYTGDPWDAADEDMETLCEPCHELTRVKDVTSKRWLELAYAQGERIMSESVAVSDKAVQEFIKDNDCGLHLFASIVHVVALSTAAGAKTSMYPPRAITNRFSDGDR